MYAEEPFPNEHRQEGNEGDIANDCEKEEQGLLKGMQG